MAKCYKPALWDKMQNCFKDYNDHMIHFVIRFDGNLDEKALYKAIDKLFVTYPILRCRFVESPFRTRWEELPYDESVLSVVEDEDDEIIQKFLCRPIDEYNEIQIRFMLLRQGEKDTLCMLLNHMVCDGNSSKQMLKTLSGYYNRITGGEEFEVEESMGNRNYEKIYDSLTLEDDIKANTRMNYSSGNEERQGFRFSDDEKHDEGRLVTGKLKRDDFYALKEYCKNNGFTLNDAIMAGFIKAMHKVSGISKPIDLDCIVDLRRFLKDKSQIGFTNCVSTTQLNVGNVESFDLREVISLVHDKMEERKNDLPGLSGLALLRINFGLFPHRLSRHLIKKNYHNPLVAVSNIGIVPYECVDFCGVKTVDMYITGSIKRNPYIQLALTTFMDEITFSIALYGTNEDFEKAQETIDKLINSLVLLSK